VLRDRRDARHLLRGDRIDLPLSGVGLDRGEALPNELSAEPSGEDVPALGDEHLVSVLLAHAKIVVEGNGRESPTAIEEKDDVLVADLEARHVRSFDEVAIRQLSSEDAEANRIRLREPEHRLDLGKL